ncbi:MAG: HAMP domain-containing histidine kinase [Methylococcaceae bacterium]|nr:HAMP domain-containing histidine kinase [Methylococcaceae bacterium]
MVSVADLVVTLAADGNPRFYAEAWPALLPIYFFTYGQMVMPVAESVIFGFTAVVAMPLAGYLINTEPESLAASVIILLIVNLFGLYTRCQLEICSRDSFRERRKAELAAEDKSEFLRHVGHNLQQPLQALGCYCAALDTALGEIPVGEARGMVRKLESAVDDLHDAFRRILDLSQVENGQHTPVVTDVALNPLLTALEIQFAPQASRKGLRLNVRKRSPPFPSAHRCHRPPPGHR